MSPKRVARRNVTEEFKRAAVQRLVNGSTSVRDLAEELGVSFWSLRRWRREYAKATAAGESTGGTPAPAAPAQETMPMSAAMIDNDKVLAETISRIESEIAHVDEELAVLNQNREALNRVLAMFKERGGSKAKRHDQEV
jgi:transposase-like protein